MSKPDELLPCFWCEDGGDPFAAFTNVKGTEVWRITCLGCHCDGPIGDNLTKAAAIKAWNTRTTPPPDTDITKAEAGIMTMKTCPRCGYDGTMPFHTCNVPKQNEIPTPRTDAEIYRLAGHGTGTSYDACVLHFARTLERELIELRRLVAGVIEYYTTPRDCYCGDCMSIKNLDSFLARHPEMGEVK